MHNASFVTIRDSLTVYISRPAQSNTRAIIVGMEIFGINDDIKAITERLSEAGFTAVAVDFYHRVSPQTSLSYSDEDRTRGLDLMKTLNREQVLDDIKETIGYLQQKEQLHQIGYLGFSIGGHIGYLAATLEGISATVAYYPGWLTDTSIPLSHPSPPVYFTKDIQCPLLLLIGDSDHLVTAQVIDAVEKALQSHHKTYQIRRYPDTKHAYPFKSRPQSYNAAASEASWEQTISFFNQHLK